jgi:signal peptidase I
LKIKALVLSTLLITLPSKAFFNPFEDKKIRILSSSMSPTLFTGVKYKVETIYDRTKINRFDIIVFNIYPKEQLKDYKFDEDCPLALSGINKCYSEEKVLYSKRIIGLPNDTISYKNGLFYVNGSPIKKEHIELNDFESEEVSKIKTKLNIKRDFTIYQESFQEHSFKVMKNYQYKTRKLEETITLNKGEYFVLGDNRTFSLDSRVLKGIKRKDMVYIIKEGE